MGNKRNRGSLTVETLLFLLPFVFAFCVVINAARLIEAQMIIHHAISQTAKEISTYSYVLTKTDVTSRMQATNKKAQTTRTQIGDTVNSLEDFANAFLEGDVGSINSTGAAAWNNVEAIANDPQSILSGVLSWAKSEAYGAALAGIAGSLAKGSIQKQINILGKDPNEYLENLGVVGGLNGLDFSKSQWDSNTGGKGNVEIVVTFTMKNSVIPMFDVGEHEYVLCASTLSW